MESLEPFQDAAHKTLRLFDEAMKLNFLKESHKADISICLEKLNTWADTLEKVPQGTISVEIPLTFPFYTL